MNPVQNTSILHFELANATPNGGGDVAGPAADAAVALTSPRSFGDSVRPTWWPRNPEPGPEPKPDPDDSHGGVPGLIDKLVDRLDAIIERLARLLGGGETPDDEDGTAVRLPGLEMKQAAGGSPSSASYLPAESYSGIDFTQMDSYSPADFAQLGSQSLLERLQV